MYRQRPIRFIVTLFLVIVAFNRATSAESDSMIIAMKNLINRAQTFHERMPREKVYVHLDNTGYYEGDKIGFQCYVVDGLSNAPTRLSRTLYVELLNPRGKVEAKQILKIDNGRCYGTFNLNHLPFYSGFYEIRAFTKYMLNFGDAAVFSRTVPVFSAPKHAGDFSEKKMERAISKYPGARPVTKAGSNVSVRFFPEGGTLIDGVRSRVAFELTGRYGVPLEGSGKIIDESTGQVIADIQPVHEGRGFFEITPNASGNYRVVITCGNDKSEHKFKLPQVRESGVGLTVDNISNPDSIFVTVRPREGAGVPPIAGVAVTSRGALWSYSMVNLNKERRLKLSSKEMPSGVSVISLFAPDGQTLAERMIFINNGGFGSISASLDKSVLQPQGKVILDLAAVNADGNPASHLPVSISVTDGDNAVDHQGGMLSDLLLMSEIKGYVRNPMQYFREDSEGSRRNLDLLMMVLGWRCYSWEEMAGINPINLKYYPEEAIDLDGKVVSFVRGIPKAGVDVSVMVSEKDARDSLRQSFTDLLTTDSCGHFRLSYDFKGKWSLVMSVSEKGKRKDYRMILDRLFSPAPRKYEPEEMLVESFSAGNSPVITPMSELDSIKNEEEVEQILKHIDDSLSTKTVRLDEVVVKGKRSDTYKARSKSLVYYDMQEELGDLVDQGEVISKDLFDVLKSINPNFHKQYNGGEERVRYKTKDPLFVIDYKVTYEKDSMNYTLLYPEGIKSVFITEDPVIMAKYADPLHYTPFTVDGRYGCAVLIETFPENRSPSVKGTRLQVIEGYTVPGEYRNIDEESMLENPDFRRTLYWNPLLTTDSDGKARVEFFNNPTCRNIRISIQGVADDGTVFSY